MDFEADKKRIFAEPDKYACLRKVKEVIDGQREQVDEDDEDAVDEVDFSYQDIDAACKELGLPVSSEGKSHAAKLMKAYASELGYIWELGMWSRYPLGPLRRDPDRKKKKSPGVKKTKSFNLFKKKDKDEKEKDKEKPKKEKKGKKDKDKKDKGKKDKGDDDDEEDSNEEAPDDFYFYKSNT